MKLIRSLPAVSLFFCLTITALAQTPPRNDTQFWNETQLAVPVSKKTDLVLTGGLRFGREISRPVDERIGAGIAFKPNRHFTIQPHYLYVAQQPFAGRKVFEHRLNLEATVRVFPGRFTIADRNRIERRVRHSSRDFTVYRNRLQIDHPARLGNFKFKPFVASEVFYDSSASTWTRNRFSVGIIREFSSRFTGEFFYLRQNDGRARPGNLHVIGTVFRIRLHN
ncbi:MAG: DUF2490 domain-containing protein [Blastocatellia bacterium]